MQRPPDRTAVLSAFLDALTVTAVVITVAAGFYGVYHKVASGKRLDMDHDPTTDAEVVDLRMSEVESAPNVGNDESSKYIQGVASRDGELLILVDLNKLLTDDEWEELANL